MPAPELVLRGRGGRTGPDRFRKATRILLSPGPFKTLRVPPQNSGAAMGTNIAWHRAAALQASMQLALRLRSGVVDLDRRLAVYLSTSP